MEITVKGCEMYAPSSHGDRTPPAVARIRLEWDISSTGARMTSEKDVCASCLKSKRSEFRSDDVRNGVVKVLERY